MSRLNMNFDEEEDSHIQFLLKDTGLKQVTELMRYLIRKEVKVINKEKEDLK